MRLVFIEGFGCHAVFVGGGGLELGDGGTEFVFELANGEELLVEFLAEVINVTYHLSVELKEVIGSRTGGCRFCFFLLCEEGASACEEVVKIEDTWKRCTDFHKERLCEVFLIAVHGG